MDYNVKIRIGDVEVGEIQSLSQKTPYITNIVLKRTTSNSAMALGSSASDSLTFTMMNPYKPSFDGEKIELFVSPQSDTSTLGLAEVEELVGDDTTTDAIDISEVSGFVDDAEEGEPLTAEELADLERTIEQNINDTYEFFNGEQVATQTVIAETSEPEWLKLGCYYVYNQTNSDEDNSIRFVCYDSFVKMGEPFRPTTKRASIQTLYDDFRDQLFAETGIEVDEFEFDDIYNVTVNWNMDTSYRDAIEYFAGLVGGYAVFGEDETLGITFYTYNDTIILDTDVRAFQETSAGELFLESISCDRAVSPFKTNIIQAGEGQGITFANPFVTEEILEDILTMYRGTRYIGAVATMVWNESMQSGQFHRIMTVAEYQNYLGLKNALAETINASERLDLMDKMNGLGKVVLFSNQTIDFTGDATTKVVSISSTEFAKSNPANSPTTGVFKNLYAEMIDANEIITDRLTAVEGVIEDLDVEHLKTNFAEINLANVNNAWIQNGQIKDASIDTAKINDATITQAWVRDVLIQGQFVAQDGTAYKLTSLHIDANDITAGTLTVDRLNLLGANGLYYQLNLQSMGQATFNQLSAEEQEKCKSHLHADSIVAHSITTDQLTTNNLVGTGGWINLANGTFAYNNATTKNGISWDGSKLTIKADTFSLSGGGSLASSGDVTNALNSAKTYTDALEIGGRNLVSNLESNWTQGNWSMPSVGGESILQNSTDRISLKEAIEVEPNANYWVKVYSSNTVWVLFRQLDSDGKYISTVSGMTNQKWTAPSNCHFIKITVYPNSVRSDIGNGTTRLKLEKGTKATDWTPAPEDLEDFASNYTDESVGVVQTSMNEQLSGLNESLDSIENQTNKNTADIQTNANDIVDARQRADAFLEFSSSKGYLEIGDRRTGKFAGTTARLKPNQLGFYPPLTEDPTCYIGKETDSSPWGLHIQQGTVENDLSFGSFQWITRDNENMSLKWKG